MKINALKQHLKGLPEAALIEIILDLNKTFKDVQEYLQVKFTPESTLEIYEKYRKLINDEFFPTRGFGKCRLSKAEKAISDFRKLKVPYEQVLDLMIFYVEIGVAFTNSYGDIDAEFYEKMENMFDDALMDIIELGLQERFMTRCEKIVEETDGIGWGFHDTLGEIYYEYFKNDGEN
ncbi:MAG: DUF6155 family protein [Proteobacteria bacterium]|nr:DUF6155 family protein [Pseudomonadota bacterium]